MMRGASLGSEDVRASLPALGRPHLNQLLIVCAHPDDESFGLGAIISAFSRAGTEVRLLTPTRGEASTLGAGSDELARTREKELAAAAGVLGIHKVKLLSYCDAALSSVPIQELARHILRAVRRADALLVFDEGGITGHTRSRKRMTVRVQRSSSIPASLPASDESLRLAGGGYKPSLDGRHPMPTRAADTGSRDARNGDAAAAMIAWATSSTAGEPSTTRRSPAR